MAQISMLNHSSYGAMLYYNVEASVGAGGANKRDDVLLIQYFLRSLATDPYYYDKLPFIQVDGVCGQQTIAAIKAYQSQPYFNLVADGRVDPMGNDTLTPNLKSYTILNLNIAFGNRRPKDQKALWKAKDLPGELRFLRYAVVGAEDAEDPTAG